MQAADFYATTGAAAMTMLAMLHARVWRAQRQRWAALFALCMAMGAAYYAFDPWLRPQGDRANPMGSILGAVLLLTMFAAMVDYVGLPRRATLWLVGLGVSAGAVLLTLRLAGVMPRVGGFISYSAYFACFAGMAAWGQRREPGRGHGLVLLALLSYPLAVVLMLLGHVERDLVRYVIIVPSVMLGMTVLTTGQMRERAAAQAEVQRRREAETELRRLNDSLEQRVAERTAELSSMVAGLESFNRSVSHDLRGPLGGMAHAARLAQLALDEGRPGDAKRFLGLLSAQADASAELVTSLLALARAGSDDLKPRALDTAALVGESLAQLRGAGPGAEPGAEPVTTCPVTVLPLPAVTADPGLLRQVFVNLLANAVKFSRGAPQPKVEVGAMSQQGQTVLYVRDNGVGFAPGAANRLFEPFQRLHDGQFAGSGVGLSIVKRIIDRHGGRLWAESSPGQGATFFFTLGPAT
jgi:signal transduction histidine kinase